MPDQEELMRPIRPIRALAVGGVLAIVAGACGGGTPSSAPSAAATTAPAATSPAGVSSPAVEPPPVTAAPASAAAGAPVEIRWYCCLGGGDAPEQVTVEKKVVEEFNASHPNIKLTFEAVP